MKTLSFSVLPFASHSWVHAQNTEPRSLFNWAAARKNTLTRPSPHSPARSLSSWLLLSAPHTLRQKRLRTLYRARAVDKVYYYVCVCRERRKTFVRNFVEPPCCKSFPFTQQNPLGRKKKQGEIAKVHCIRRRLCICLYFKVVTWLKK